MDIIFTDDFAAKAHLSLSIIWDISSLWADDLENARILARAMKLNLLKKSV
jgi:hypothetical protein